MKQLINPAIALMNRLPMVYKFSLISILFLLPIGGLSWLAISELKRSVQLRYQESVDLKEFEPKIQKLLDDHVVAMPAETIIADPENDPMAC